MNELSQRQALRALRQERQPSRDLWPEIAGRLGPPASQRRHSRWWIAVAASLVLALPAPLLWQGPPNAPPQSPPAEGLVRDADAMAIQYRAALAELSAAPLPLSLRGLADDLERDAEHLHQTLEAHPQALVVLHQLRRTYDQRLRLSQRAALG